MTNLDEAYLNAAAAINAAEALLITGGAGMGVDSGLPDFRGKEGFWEAYPMLKASNTNFQEIADPRNFIDQPREAWGFYGHRLNLYRRTIPHDGFRMLLELGEARPKKYFVFTSNVDGHYQKSGFDPHRVMECHGSINHLQCINDCCGIWSGADASVDIDARYCTAEFPLPECPHCNALARPNILMFGDNAWNQARQREQNRRYQSWLASLGDGLVTIECGAGTSIPTVRREGDFHWGTLIRINPTEPLADKPKSISIRSGALAAIRGIYDAAQNN